MRNTQEIMRDQIQCSHPILLDSEFDDFEEIELLEVKHDDE